MPNNSGGCPHAVVAKTGCTKVLGSKCCCRAVIGGGCHPPSAVRQMMVRSNGSDRIRPDQLWAAMDGGAWGR